MGLFFSYLFLPFNQIQFAKKTGNNFNFSSINSSMQFYTNMRFPDKIITYKISNCPLQKENDMKSAFDDMAGRTILLFNSVSENEDISITCDSGQKTAENENGVFIAGEGGPTEVLKTPLFNIILHGKILLIRQSECMSSNIATHELLHVLGFDHSANPSNIMYPVSNCDQVVSDDISDLIDQLYTIDSKSDLSLDNISASIKGRYLDCEINILNQGLKKSEQAEILIYNKDNLVKRIDLRPINIGEGLKITLRNLWIYNPIELKFMINSSFDELDKENNQATLEIIK